MRLVVLAFFGFCAVSTLRLAVAGYGARLDSSPAVERAAIAVESAGYAERLADIDPGQARDALRRAIRWNPRSSTARIALGLEEERSGDFESAERDLLAAAEVDRQYTPAWTLTNFYFRREDHSPFRKWARRSAELAPGDLEPLLVLCDRMDPGQALGMLPEQKRLEWAYFNWLIRENRLEDAGRGADKLASRHEADDIRRLTGFTTRLVEAHRDTDAIALWRRLFQQAGLINGDLRTAPTGEGFDWRMRPVEGVTASWSPGVLTFLLAGLEPESCVLIEQPLPVGAGRYQLRFEYATAGARGVRWMLDSLESAELPASNGWAGAERDFSTGRNGLAWLRLVYRRDFGLAKAEGEIRIRNVRWDKN